MSAALPLFSFKNAFFVFIIMHGALTETIRQPANGYHHRLKRSRPAELYNFNFDPFTENQLWPGGIVSYRFDSEYPFGWMRDRVLQAFSFIQQLSCVRFQLVNANYKGSFIRVTNGDLCSSQVGRLIEIQDGQVLSLPAWCLRRPEGALHEIMHVLGFAHEQSRTDRGKYLSINWENIPKDAWYLYSAGSDAHALLEYRIPYDYASILHYGPNDFAINKGQPTLISNVPQFRPRINSQLSALDVVKLNAAYKCTAKKMMTDCVDYLSECRTVSAEQCRTSSYMRDVCQTTCRSCRAFV